MYMVWCVCTCVHTCVHVVWCVCTYVVWCVYMCTYVHVCMGCGVCVRVYIRTCVRCGVVCACAYVCIISRYVIFSTPGPSVLAVLLRLSFDAVSSGHSEIDVQLGNKIKLHGCG